MADPAVDTGYDDGVNNDLINPVQATTLERDLFGDDGPPPELYPGGATGIVEGANPVPGQTAIDELPVPPPAFQIGTEGGAVPMGEDDEDAVEGDDLFGDEGDDDDELMQPAQASLDAAAAAAAAAAASPEADTDALTEEERARRRRLEYEEEEEERYLSDDGLAAQTITQEERIAQVPLANFSIPAGGKVWHAKLPNFLGLETGAWDERSWQPDEEAEAAAATNQEASQGEDVKPHVNGAGKGNLPDENVIRWRWTKDELGEVVKQSNARIVRWSDGSLSLQLGSELFDISLALDHSASLSRAANPVPPSTSTSLTPTSFSLNQGHGLTYLTARHDYNRLYESQASIGGTMTFRPSTLASQTHKRLAGVIAARHAAKGRGVKMQDLPEMDPERKKLEREKAEVEKARRARKEALRAAGGRRGGARKKGKKATTIEGLTDEEDEDEDGTGWDDRRSQPKRGRGGALQRSYSDEEEEDDDGFVAKSDDDMQMSDADKEEIEQWDEAAEREERRRKDRRKQRDFSSSDAEQDKEKEAAGVVKRRLVVESDEDE
ncbi:SPOSA6832_02941 [Sporobolomyces salmonicolor]|uniref:SPOSA6832_02941-mRNA-1:cds n=1 Tax=Sporidiobolus salmonicolor TaxID=5005 RepID=A0A0D6ENU2_SPOSA|nr:SPOSA6832_02941 [Sporobolomyces salmonicolor]